MATAYNAISTKYNDSKDFAKLNVTDAKKITFSEAVFRKTDDRMTVFAWVESIEGEVKNYDDNKFVFTPQLCQFELLIKGYEYKEKKVEPTNGMKCAIKYFSPYEGVCFGGFFDFSVDDWTSEILMDGTIQGQPADPTLATMIGSKQMAVALVDMVKLEGVTIPEGKARSGGFGRAAQTELSRLEDRVRFLTLISSPDSDYRKLCASLGQEPEPNIIVMLSMMLG